MHLGGTSEDHQLPQTAHTTQLINDCSLGAEHVDSKGMQQH